MKRKIPLLFLLMLAVGRSAFAAVGDIVEQYTFEDGRTPDPSSAAWTLNAVPAEVRLEGSNHYLRLTASPSDCSPTGSPPFNVTCPSVREELHIADLNWQASDSNPSTFCMDLRLPSSNPTDDSNLAQIYFYSGQSPIPGTWAVALTGPISSTIPSTIAIPTRPSADWSGYMLPAYGFDQWHNVCLTVFFSYTAGYVDVWYDGAYQTRLTRSNGSPLDTIYVSGNPALAQLWVNVYGTPGSVDLDNIRIVKGAYGSSPTVSLTSISPSTINLANPPSTITVTGTGLGDQGFGCPYLNFYTVPGDVRLLDAPAITCTNTTLTQNFNSSLFSAGTYRAKAWTRPTSSTFVQALPAQDFTVTGAPIVPTDTITWSSDRGPSGTVSTASLPNWSISNIPLSPGANVITVTYQTAAGQKATDQITVSSGNIVAISAPTSGPRFITTNQNQIIAGTASCTTGTPNVTWINDQGGGGTATTGGTTWSFTAAMTPNAINTITVTSECSTGSVTATLAIAYSPAVSLLEMAFDENTGTTPQDVSGNANNGVMAGGPAYTASAQKYGASAIDFNSAGSVTVTSTMLQQRIIGGFSIVAWINPDTSSTTSMRAAAVNNYSQYLYVTNSGTGNCQAGMPLFGMVSGGSDVFICPTTPPPTGQYSCIAGTYDGTAMKVYINSAEVASLPMAYEFPDNPATGAFQIGNSTYTEPADAKIDEVRFRQYGMSAAEVATACNTQIGTPPITAPTGLSVGSVGVKVGDKGVGIGF